MDWSTPQVIVGIIGLFVGGLSGAIFTWWIKRDPTATVGYTVTTTTIGADPAVQTLVPNLAIRIGKDDIPALHTHSIELNVMSGFSQSGQIAFVFLGTTRIYGEEYLAPTQLHKVDISSLNGGTLCTFSPLEKGRKFIVRFACSNIDPPELQTAGRDFRLRPLADLAVGGRSAFWIAITGSIAGALGASGSVLIDAMLKIFKR